MQVNGSRILILGGYGLVGSAIAHELMKHNPKQIVISSLKQSEAESACEEFRKEYPEASENCFIPHWGNIFARTEWKDLNWGEVLNDVKYRKEAINDIFNPLDDELLESSALYSVLMEYKPDIVFDCINTATIIAYQNVYDNAQYVKGKIEDGSLDDEDVEKLISSMYMPQLIRHIQILQKSLEKANSKFYLKIGTSGTGGMGLNIPYTHSEERPSRVLLSKTAVAGAHSLLLFLMARTPNAPIIKEIKPTATIAWKKIAYDTVLRKGKPIPMCDMPFDKAYEIEDKFDLEKNDNIVDKGEVFKSVFIDTGENGIFSKGEFKAIGSLGQMEIVTPQEIAEYAVYELISGNSGHDLIQGLDAFTMGPTYRGGMLYNTAVEKIDKLEKENNIDSIAFEMLGPPRLSKLLFEAYILKRIIKSMDKISDYSASEISKMAEDLIKNDERVRSEMLSIGLVILLSDGKKYLRGVDIKVPSGNKIIKINQEKIDKWCKDAWIDLRSENFELWKNRINEIINQANKVSETDTSSRYVYTKDYWDNFEKIDEGKLAAWIFEYEDKGWRWKR